MKYLTKPNTLISMIDLVNFELDKSSKVATVSFYNKASHVWEDKLHITKIENDYQFNWEKKSFSPHLREALELRALVEMECELQERVI